MNGVTGSLPPTGPPASPDPIGPYGEPAPLEDAGIAGSVGDEWVEVYPPDDAQPDDDVDEFPSGPSRLGLLSVGLFVASLVLVVIGSVQPLFRAGLALGPSYTNVTNALTVDAWELTSANVTPDQQLGSHSEATPIPIGYPLLVAVLLLLLVMGLWLRAGRHPSAEGPAKVVGVIAATFLTGLVLALGMFELAWSNLGSSDAIGGIQSGVGVGFWVLVVASSVAVVAAVLAYRVQRDDLADYVDDESDQDDAGEWPNQPAAEGQVPPGQPAEWPVVAVIPADERTNW
jgi:hypothetical protein